MLVAHCVDRNNFSVISGLKYILRLLNVFSTTIPTVMCFVSKGTQKGLNYKIRTHRSRERFGERYSEYFKFLMLFIAGYTESVSLF